tara:strand:+ start:8097 stop:8909 length:813 start_codon:yes stop_codon:yes gene_type:complete
MKIILILGLIIFIQYSFYYNKKTPTSIEQFSSINKKLDYMLQNPEKTSMLLKNILGDTMNNSGYYDLRDPKKSVELKNKLDKLSKIDPSNKEGALDALSVPMPSMIKKLPEYNPVKSSKKKVISKKKSKILVKGILNKNYCKFISSTSENQKCPIEYPVYTGASFSGSGTSIRCDGKPTDFIQAKAVAMVNNGKLHKILLITGGTGYQTPPAINIIGNGINGICKAHVKKGSITKIEIISKGSDYTSTPIVQIDKPNINLHCKLCCKSEL